jgi:hypothetical protein
MDLNPINYYNPIIAYLTEILHPPLTIAIERETGEKREKIIKMLTTVRMIINRIFGTCLADVTFKYSSLVAFKIILRDKTMEKERE